MVRVSHDASKIVFCIARRNDQPTTFDDRIELNLQRLLGMSYSIELKDFSRHEAVLLLSHLREEIGQPIKPSLTNLALEFAASGFPWLCKRVGAHIRDAVQKKDLSQDELIQNGIRPEELFEEDLTELDIVDREFLKDLAKYLPATLSDLSLKFDGQQLASKLRRLQDLRLVRLIGRAYDTYNDVFKEYLKTGEIPLPSKYVFRMGPSTAKQTLDVIISHSCENVRDISTRMPKLTPDTLQNVLRELRMLGLVETLRGHITVDIEAADSYRNSKLDSLLKERVWRRNRARTRGVEPAGDAEPYHSQPAHRLSSGWSSRAGSLRKKLEGIRQDLAGWLRFVGLVRPGQIVDERNKPVGATRRLALSKREMFLPSIYIAELVSAVEKFRRTDTMHSDELGAKVAYDCINVGLIRAHASEGFLVLTEAGSRFLMDELARSLMIKEFLLSQTYVPGYLDLIRTRPCIHVDVLQAVLGDMAFTEEPGSGAAKYLRTG